MQVAAVDEQAGYWETLMSYDTTTMMMKMMIKCPDIIFLRIYILANSFADVMLLPLSNSKPRIGIAQLP